MQRGVIMPHHPVYSVNAPLTYNSALNPKHLGTSMSPANFSASDARDSSCRHVERAGVSEEEGLGAGDADDGGGMSGSNSSCC